MKYNSHHAPLPVQFFLYLFVGGPAAVLNLFVFPGLLPSGAGITAAALAAFYAAACLNYILCIRLLFRRQAQWDSLKEIIIYVATVLALSGLDALLAGIFVNYLPLVPAVSKILASAALWIPNFLARRFIVFPESPSGE